MPRPRPALAHVLPLLATLFLPLSLLAASYTWNVDGTGIWNDTLATPGNWNTPNVVPVSGDNVTINRANGATVAFASSNFDTAPEALASLTIGGAGPNTLQIGSNDTLRYTGVFTVNSGGQLDMSGGAFNHLSTASAINVNNGSVKITDGTWNIDTQQPLNLANGAGQNASLEVSGSGQLLMVSRNNSNNLLSTAGNSTLTLADSGVITAFRNVYVGTVGGTHTWTISGGTFTRNGTSSSGIFFGNNDGLGSVDIVQTGGSFNNGTSPLYVSGTAEYQISGLPATVTITNGTLYVDGQFNQTGGRVYNTYELHVGSTAGANAAYTATAGELRVRGFSVGRTPGASGTLTLHEGVAFETNSISGSFPQSIEIGAVSGNGTGTLEIQGMNGISGNGFRQPMIHQTGTLKGYGTLTITGGTMANSMQMNGRVIANGYGVDRTLNLPSTLPAPITNTVDNLVGGNLGWYAVNHGKLTLPNITVPAGASDRNWGEDATDTTPDLVNSLRLEFTDIQTAGPLTISLLASDRGDVPEALYAAYGGALIGVWDIAPATGSAFAFGPNGAVDLTFRYDDALAPATQDLILFHYTGGQWVPITSGIDLNNKTIWADGVTSFSLFAVGYIPEPASALLLALASLAARRRW